MVNGMGGTPLQELYLLNNAVRKFLKERNILVYRSFVGNYMTSIDMQGASISFARLDEQLKELIDAPCDTPALSITGACETTDYCDIPMKNKAVPEAMQEFSDGRTVKCDTLSLANIVSVVKIMCECIIKNEVPFCDLDAHAGDGDFGMSIAKGFRQVQCEWADIIENHCKDIGEFLNTCSLIIMEHCGGASGPIWGSAFRYAAAYCLGKTELDASDYAGMLQNAVKGIQITGERSFGRGAVVGDKTLIDALVPCADAVSALAAKKAAFAEIIRAGANAAVEGARSTENIVARMGRAGTIGERSIGYPDAGAYALGVIFTDIADKLSC